MLHETSFQTINIYSISCQNQTLRQNDFHFPILNFPFICRNILAAPVYELYLSQLIRYSSAVVPVMMSLIDG
jgi:hypothetical protein